MNIKTTVKFVSSVDMRTNIFIFNLWFCKGNVAVLALSQKLPHLKNKTYLTYRAYIIM